MKKSLKGMAVSFLLVAVVVVGGLASTAELPSIHELPSLHVKA